jgi:hypothetical protein
VNKNIKDFLENMTIDWRVILKWDLNWVIYENVGWIRVAQDKF